MKKDFFLKEEVISIFEKDGVVVLRNVVNKNWRKILINSIENEINEPGPYHHFYKSDNCKGKFHGSMRIWEHDHGFKKYCLKSPLPFFAAQLLKSNKVNLLYDQLFVKEPKCANRVRWHNDQPYWPIRGWSVMSFWLPLDRVTKGSGAMEFIRGSHKWCKWYQPEPFAQGVSKPYEKNSKFEKIPDIESNREKFDIISFDMNPGDLLAFHALVIHGSGGNFSKDLRRRAYAVRYTGDNVIYSEEKGSHKDLRNSELNEGDSLTTKQYPMVWKNGSYIYSKL